MSRRKIKLFIPIVLLFMIIGFATISTTLSINTNIEMLSDLSDFSVYYSRVLVNGEEDPSIITSSKGLDFSGILDKVGTTYVVEYDITNASASFDADITMNCTGSTEYFEISNVFDTSTDLGARQTRTGILTLKKIKTIADNTQNSKVSCELIATPVERTEEGSGDVPLPLEKIDLYEIGTEIVLDSEKFNVISDNGDTITMLAKYNLGTNYRQTTDKNPVRFSDSAGWEYTPGPQEIDIQVWSSNSKTYIYEYVNYLKNLLNDDSVIGDLITLNQLNNFGCIVPVNYESPTSLYDRTCEGSEHIRWLANGQNWWTRSANSDKSHEVWLVNDDGSLNYFQYTYSYGIRPTITVSKTALNKIKSNLYEIGKEIIIADEKFNIISDNGLTVTMLAQYNLADNYKQSEESNLLCYYCALGMYDIPEGDFSISEFPEIYGYIVNYVDYLNREIGSSILNANIITLDELLGLGCEISSDGVSNYTCIKSSHYHWLINGQDWWTRTSSGVNSPYFVSSDGLIYSDSLNGTYGVRPTVTISKLALEN